MKATQAAALVAALLFIALLLNERRTAEDDIAALSRQIALLQGELASRTAELERHHMAHAYHAPQHLAADDGANRSGTAAEPLGPQSLVADSQEALEVKLMDAGMTAADSASAVALLSQIPAPADENLAALKAEQRARLTEIRAVLTGALGEQAYDSYLFATGRNNRLQVFDVIGDAAREKGIRVGDRIHSIDGRRIYSHRDIQQTQALADQGEELVEVSVVRDGSLISIYLPRGNLGLRTSSLSVNPAGS